MTTTITNIATAKGTAPAPDIATDKTNASVPVAATICPIVSGPTEPYDSLSSVTATIPIFVTATATAITAAVVLDTVTCFTTVTGLTRVIAINTVTVTNTVIMTTVINSVVGTVDWTAEAAVRTTLQTSTVQFLSMLCTLSLPSSLTSVTP